ncbi:DUF317 domain-containing protein [Streptomyces noursei]|uniref:DUF317 domain-containing protein n=1 Tax=Streptomyces noursei TaxID=1971 RepID=UPI0033250057
MSHERFSSRVNGPTLHRIKQVRHLDEGTPRHLAGGGDPLHVTEYLLAAGWSNHSDPDYPHVVLASPDLRHTVVLEPEATPYQPWWRIRGVSQGHRWYTDFDAHTLVEILAGLTDALIAPEPTTTPGRLDDAHLGALELRARRAGQ